MILDEIVAFKRNQIDEKKQTLPQAKLKLEGIIIRDFKKALDKEGISIIAEVKKASPSKGIILEDFEPSKISRLYEDINVDAVSVLTEKHFFKGDDSFIEVAKSVNSKPILRKDFIIDEYQLYEAKSIYADAVLLIVAILGDRLKHFYELARGLGLACLVEVHNLQELSIAIEAGCEIIGINNRDLRDFSVDLRTTEKLLGEIPRGVTVVSESGIRTIEDIRYLRSIGVDAILVGETFMRGIKDEIKLRGFVDEIKGLI